MAYCNTQFTIMHSNTNVLCNNICNFALKSYIIYNL